jgi:hypothetical protein
MAVQQIDETSMLISVRFLSDPNFSNHMIPASRGRISMQVSDETTKENNLKLAASFRLEKKFILNKFFDHLLTNERSEKTQN